jgi:perosamine synthetase
LIPVNRPLVTPEDVLAVSTVLSDGWISGDGPIVRDFERHLAEAIGTAHAVGLSTGTAACDITAEALKIGSGDRVVVPATTIISTASNFARLGAQLELVDADPLTWCMQTDGAVEAITPDTRAVVAVHIYGLPVDMDPILDAARKVSAWVIEDAAEAIGLSYKGRPCGSIGDIGIFSFYANKTVTAGEGGAVVTSNEQVADEVRSLRNLCFQASERFVHERLGYNARMSSLTAALAQSQLGRLASLVKRKRALGARYSEGLRGHPWLQLPIASTEYAQNSYWVYGVVLQPDAPSDAPEVMASLRARGIDTRRFFYPLNQQPALINAGCVSSRPMPVSENLWHRGFYVPSGVGTTDQEIDETIENLWRVCA